MPGDSAGKRRVFVDKGRSAVARSADEEAGSNFALLRGVIENMPFRSGLDQSPRLGNLRLCGKDIQSTKYLVVSPNSSCLGYQPSRAEEGVGDLSRPPLALLVAPPPVAHGHVDRHQDGMYNCLSEASY